MDNKQIEVRLDGKWRVSRTFNVKNTDEQELVLFDNEQRIVEFSSDDTITERSGDEVTTTTYHYDPATRTIGIGQTDRRQPSPVSGGPENTYRIIPLNDREMYFQRPASVEDDGDEFETILLERI